MGRKAGRPSKGMVLSKHNIELAIKSTQSMGQASLYMGVAKILSKNTQNYTDYGVLRNLPKASEKQEMWARNSNTTSNLF